MSISSQDHNNATSKSRQDGLKQQIVETRLAGVARPEKKRGATKEGPLIVRAG